MTNYRLTLHKHNKPLWKYCPTCKGEMINTTADYTEVDDGEEIFTCENSWVHIRIIFTNNEKDMKMA